MAEPVGHVALFQYGDQTRTAYGTTFLPIGFGLERGGLRGAAFTVLSEHFSPATPGCWEEGTPPPPQ